MLEENGKVGGTIMQIISATKVRKKWSEFIDVVKVRPSVVKRRRDLFAVVSINQTKHILTPYCFKIEYVQEDNGTYSGSLEGFDLVANAPSIEDLKRSLAEELVDYAKEYFEEIDRYYLSPNRKEHFPYILNVLIQEKIDDVVSLID